MRVIHAGRIDPDPRWRLPRDRHAYHELIVVVGGRMRVDFDDAAHEGTAGSAFLYRAGDAHAESSDSVDPVSTRYCCFEADLAPGRCRQVEDRQGRLRVLATWLVESWSDSHPMAVGVHRGLAAALLAEWERLAAAPQDPLVQAVQEHLQRHLAAPLGVADLAAVVGLSPFHFQRRYRALTGRTPMEDLRRARIAAARQWVVESDLPLREIPARVGLATVQHLTRLFRAELGITPGAMRAGRRGMTTP